MMKSLFGSLQKLAEASIEELSSVKGIGLAKATQIKAVFEIGRRLSTQTPAYKKKEPQRTRFDLKNC